MTNIISLLILLMNCFYGFSQDVNFIYCFKKNEKEKFKGTTITYSDVELDSLVLYKNGEFYRQNSYSQFDNFGFTEQKGRWKREDKIVLLEIQYENETLENTWEPRTGKIRYKISGKKLVPQNDGTFEIFAYRKLKLIKN